MTYPTLTDEVQYGLLIQSGYCLGDNELFYSPHDAPPRTITIVYQLHITDLYRWKQRYQFARFLNVPFPRLWHWSGNYRQLTPIHLITSLWVSERLLLL